MHKRYRSVGLAILFAGVCTKSLATGDWVSLTVLQDGARQVMATPEFFWELELRRIAQEFAPAEKRVVAPRPKDVADQNADMLGRAEFTAKVDQDDFAAAIKAGDVKPADAAKAIEQHNSARVILDTANEKTTDPLPAEHPSEFADYHQGAYGFKTAKPDLAREAWGRLLARPAAERKHRSIWAAFMLGKVELEDSKYDEAVKRFQQARQLAKEGFADSLGLAADSYGWEARCELESGHAANAARLYLTQMALGDSSAVSSLKLLVPDRLVAGFSDALNTEADVTTEAAYAVKTVEEALAMAAADPVLRRLVTAHVLAVGVAPSKRRKSRTRRTPSISDGSPTAWAVMQMPPVG
jgi:hypothetical protein